jgi:hypothetical protein
LLMPFQTWDSYADALPTHMHMHKP